VNLSIEQIADLFVGLEKLPKAVKREQTFMEIAGYPHFENVCSNILAFYLQPNNGHGFGTLFLDVLATLINEEGINDGQGVDVRREEITENGKRIDLVIESDSHIFGIENKIFAGLYNDFDDYSKHLESLSNGHQVYKILLSLRSVQPSPQLHGFHPISYEIFFQKVLANIGLCFLTAHEPHTTFLRDFMQILQNLQEVTTMDRQRLEYFQNNQQQISTLLNEVDGLRKDMRKKVSQLKEAVAFENIYPIQSGLWRSSKDLIDVIWYTVKIDDALWIQFDVYLTPTGWKMHFWNRKGSRKQVEQWLQAQEINVVEINIGNIWRLVYNGADNIKPYAAELDDVRRWAIDMFDRLTASTSDRSTDSSTSLANLNLVDRISPSRQLADPSAPTTSTPYTPLNVIKLN
jgi:PD-(D/E)XK nuclease superfamily